MRFAYFSGTMYRRAVLGAEWPHPPETHSHETAQTVRARLERQARVADAAGFDWIALSELHARAFLSPNPIVMAANIAEWGLKAGVMLPILQVAGRDLAGLAEDLGALGHLLKGKLRFGLCSGQPSDAIVWGLSRADAEERVIEAAHFLARAWSEPRPFAWSGRHFERRQVAVWPQPYPGVSARPFICAVSVAEAEAAGRGGFGLGIEQIPLEAAERLADAYREAAEAAGRRTSPEDVYYLCETHVARDDAEAAAHLERYRLGILGNPLAGQTRRMRALRAALESDDAEDFNLLRFHGGPEAVAEGLQGAARRIGFGLVVSIFQGLRVPAEINEQSIHLFGSQVIPALAKASGRTGDAAS